MEWINNHWNDILSVVGAVILAITLVVRLTSTDKDDTFWAKCLKVLSALSLCNPDGSLIGKKESAPEADAPSAESTESEE